MDCNNVNTLLNRYESILSAQMTKSLGKSIINLYSNIACSVLGIGSQQELSTDLESDPIHNTAMQRFTCDLYYRFGTLLAPVSVGIITGKHYTKNSVTKLNDRSENRNCETVTKQKNPPRIEQGQRLVEYNCRKKEELKHVNKLITRKDGIDHKLRTDLNCYVYVGGLSLFGLYLLYSKFKKPERNLINVPLPPAVKTNPEPERDIFEML